jgi:hypothetical protein
MGHNAIGFTHLLFFEKWFRDTMRYLVQNDTENADSGLSINIKCFTSTPAQTDQTQNITLVTNFFETADECPQESTIQYPLWTQSSDQVEYSASWPRVGDALFDKKKDAFALACDKLVVALGDDQLPVRQLTIKDAQLFSSVDTYIQLRVMVEKGLIRIRTETTDDTNNEFTHIHVQLTAHLQPPRGQLGAPWLLAATEWGMKHCTTYEGRLYANKGNTTSRGYPLLSDLDWLLSNLNTHRTNITLNEFVNIHITVDTPTELPSDCRSICSEDRPAKKAKRNAVPHVRVAVISAQTVRCREKRLFYDLPLCMPIEACDAKQGLPEHTVMLTDSVLSVHDVVRVLACMHRNKEQRVSHLHIVTASKNDKKKYITDFYKSPIVANPRATNEVFCAL